jgi:subtilisin family serine protease
MRASRNVVLVFAAVLALPAAESLAQSKLSVRAPVAKSAAPAASSSGPSAPSGGGDYRGGYSGGGGYGGLGAVSGILQSIPRQGPYYGPPQGGGYVDDGSSNGGPYNGGPQGPRQSPQQSARRGPSGVPPANEHRLVPDEVVIELRNTVPPQAIAALERRYRLTRIESQSSQLTGTTMFRWRIPDRRSVAAVVRALEGDAVVASAQPNYLFTLQDDTAPSEGDPAQYALAKLHLPQAHGVAKGDGVLVAVIDSGVDITHPELAGAIAGTFDALDTPAKPHSHGTAIAALIAGHARLMGSAPAARILAVRAFDPAGASAEGTTFSILKGIDWAAAHGARVINMSFAGPGDPAIFRSLEAARKKGIVAVAAVGNAGPKSLPLYPAGYPNVIAVTATDSSDKLFDAANRGRYIAVAAPGVQILVAIPDGGYEVSSGTSYSAAEVSGIVALMLERRPNLTPDAVRATLLATARDLGPRGRDDMFGAGLADAYRAVSGQLSPVAAEMPVQRIPVNSGAR